MISAASAKAPHGARRSGKWSALRRAFLKGKCCAVCGGTKKLEAHHVRPFHLFPRLELDVKNLIPLCEQKRSGVNCHLLFGHLGNFRSVNITVRADAARWKAKLKHRPKAA